MLTITLIPDSAAAEIFAVKCCGGALPDQNLEILIANRGPSPVAIDSRIALAKPGAVRAITAVCPAGGRTVPPGEVASLYTALDTDVLKQYRHIVLFDREGRPYRFALQSIEQAAAGDGRGALARAWKF
jgi:hypothetical protein